MKLTIEIDTTTFDRKAFDEITTFMHSLMKILPEDLPDVGVDTPVITPLQDVVKIDPSVTAVGETGDLFPETLVSPVPPPPAPPMPPQPPLSPTPLAPPTPPAPPQSEFTKMMLRVSDLLTQGKVTHEVLGEFAQAVGAIEKGKGVIGKLKELPELIPPFMELVETHVIPL